MHRRTWLIIAALVAAAGCSSKGHDEPAASDKSAPAARPAEKSAQTAKPPLNLDKYVAAVLGCTWNADMLGYEVGCQPTELWSEATLKQTDKIVALLKDKRYEVRWIAAAGISSSSRILKDKALVDAVLAAAKQETNSIVAAKLGSAFAKIDVEATGAGPRVLALIDTANSVELRKELAGSVVINNPSMLTPILERFRTATLAEVRVEIAVSLQFVARREHQDAICKAWIGAIADKDDDVAGRSAAFVARTRDCDKHRPAIRAQLDKLSKKRAGQENFIEARKLVDTKRDP